MASNTWAKENSLDADFIIVGSGFGGSVSAYYLSQKGYRVIVLEKGKEYKRDDFPKSNFQIKKYLWAPLLRCFGIQELSFPGKFFILHGSGVGGGSLVYANTLMQPSPAVFQKESWPASINWNRELEGPYSRAKKMLGVVENPHLMAADLAIKNLSRKMESEHSFHPTEVGVYFGEEGKSGIEVPDPFFNGAGPKRVGCTLCGGCMIGCSVGAKNTLDLNYLYFARKQGAIVIPEREVIKIIPNDDSYLIETKITTAFPWQSKKQVYRARKIILSAGVMGTLKILFYNKYVTKTLPHISDTLGKNVLSNGESLLGATALKSDLQHEYSKGIAIGSAFHPNTFTKIEPVRYPRGSDLMKFLSVPLTGDGILPVRWGKMITSFIVHLPQLIRLILSREWASRTIILLVMESRDVFLRFNYRKWPFFGLKGHSPKEQNSVFNPLAQKAASLLAQEIGGVAQNAATEVLFGAVTTAHILGGAVLASNEQQGVVDTNHEVFNYKGLYICDGSVIPSNLGVNPSLTITALAERFTSQIESNTK